MYRRFLYSNSIFFLFSSKGLKYGEAFEINPVLNISRTFLCINRKTLDRYSTVGARGNYLERVATLQVEEAMLITLVDLQDAASSTPFVQTLCGLINYGTMCR